MTTIGPTMSPRPRRKLHPRSKKFEVRAAIRLRKLLDDRGIGPSEFLRRLHANGVDVTIEAVKKWLNGDHVPRPQDMEAIGRILEMKDYREVWPPEFKR